jgi:hypothetical protein
LGRDRFDKEEVNGLFIMPAISDALQSNCQL